jgi:hypothetical protein
MEETYCCINSYIIVALIKQITLLGYYVCCSFTFEKEKKSIFLFQKAEPLTKVTFASGLVLHHYGCHTMHALHSPNCQMGNSTTAQMLCSKWEPHAAIE